MKAGRRPNIEPTAAPASQKEEPAPSTGTGAHQPTGSAHFIVNTLGSLRVGRAAPHAGCARADCGHVRVAIDHCSVMWPQVSSGDAEAKLTPAAGNLTVSSSCGENQAQPAVAALSDLPQELLLSIFVDCTIQQLRNLKCTCKTFEPYVTSACNARSQKLFGKHLSLQEMFALQHTIDKKFGGIVTLLRAKITWDVLQGMKAIEQLAALERKVFTQRHRDVVEPLASFTWGRDAFGLWGPRGRTDFQDQIRERAAKLLQ